MIGKYFSGWLLWQKLKIKFRINYDKVVIVLSGENEKLDRQVMEYLPDFMERKRVTSAVILCRRKDEWEGFAERTGYIISEIFEEEMVILYSFYSFIKFYDNIVFTNTDKPEDNMLGRYIRETDINEVDAACLALYHLRHIPEHGDGI